MGETNAAAWPDDVDKPPVRIPAWRRATGHLYAEPVDEWTSAGMPSTWQPLDLPPSRAVTGPADLLALLATTARRDRLTHVEVLPSRPGVVAAWPDWADLDLIDRWAAQGVMAPWTHQRAAADLLHAGRSVIVATGTGSGKTLAYALPALDAVVRGTAAIDGRGATVLYLAPTKALGADQARVLASLALPTVRFAVVDGDTAREERDWARRHASYVLTNPDLLHHSLLPAHARWAPFLRSVKYVIVDEAHIYRGIFGAHVAQVLRRLRRVCRSYGADPVFALASATIANPSEFAERLIGAPVHTVDNDGAPRGESHFVLWEPPVVHGRGGRGAARRSAVAEAAELTADLVAAGARTVAFVRSRRAAETLALAARARLDERQPGLGASVAAYRAGYLPEERRALEADLQSGRVRGLASTNALELGVDVSGLDAVVLAGYPGSRASTWQQVGRAGRSGRQALAVLVARDDPFDTYLVHHPEVLFGASIEQTVLDPNNPYVLGPHLAAAAAELPLRHEEMADFGPNAVGVAEQLTEEGLLRHRESGWYWTRRDRASAMVDLRGTGARPVRLVEAGTGRVLGTVDHEAAPRTVHPGAVYVHQGVGHLVDALDLDSGCALIHQADPDYVTTSRETSVLRILSVRRSRRWGVAELCDGDVEATAQVVAFVRRRAITGEFLGEVPLDLPPRSLTTRAVWWTVPAEELAAAGVSARDVAGACHAVEHAALALLPLVAECDAWDTGGSSAALHADTGKPTVFVHDRHPGGAGFAERGYDAARTWLDATRLAIMSCTCEDGCPSCVQSPSCGSGNAPLNKQGAITLLDVLLGDGDVTPPAPALEETP